MPKGVNQNFAKFMDLVMHRQGLRNSDIQDRTSLSRVTVYRHLKGEVMPSLDDRERYSGAVGMAFDEFEKQWQNIDDAPAPKRSAFFLEWAGSRMPHVFNLGIAASGWVEIDGSGHARGPVQMNDRLLIVKVSGDSMDPPYADGQSVLFYRLSHPEDSPQVGSDYFFIRNDGTGTFKRLAEIDDETYVLKALNPKYRKPLSVSQQEVVMIAEARLFVGDIPRGKGNDEESRSGRPAARERAG